MSRLIVALGLAVWLLHVGAPADGAAAGHMMPLPSIHRRPVPGYPNWWSAPDAVAGANRGSTHLRGTVYVGEAPADRTAPTIAEYDVATRRLLRRADLPIDPVILAIHIVRTGDQIHVFAYARPRSPHIYVRLDTSLQVEAGEVLGSVDGIAVGADENFVALLWCGTRERSQRPRGIQLLTLDASGHHVGDVLVSHSQVFMYEQPIAVLDGKVYLLGPDGGLPPITRLSADARVEDAHNVIRSPTTARCSSSRETICSWSTAAPS